MRISQEETALPSAAEETRRWPLLSKEVTARYLKALVSLWLCVAFFYVALWGIFRESLYHGGDYYQLTALTVTLTVGHCIGEIITIVKVPNIVGMTIAGLLLRNLPGDWAVAAAIDANVISVLRNIALTVIMLEAGMGLDLAVLSRLKAACIRLALLPGLAETFATCLIAYQLMQMPFLWGLMAGFALKAVSPAVVVPACVDLQRRQRGTRKGIPTLIVASASFDDVVAIAAFGVLCTVIFSTGDSLVWTICRGPVAVISGIVYGIVVGLIFWLLQNDSGSNLFRGLLLLCASLAATFVGEAVGFESAGPIGCIVVGATAVYHWRKDEATHSTLEDAFACLWKFLENVLFVLIGASADLSQIDTSTLLYAILTLVLTHIVRLIVAFLVMLGAGFSLKERIFIAIAWLPKATVQAALGSIALDIARGRGADPDEMRLSQAVLTLAILSILLTAPLGAGATKVLADRLLDDDSVKEGAEDNSNGYQSSATASTYGAISSISIVESDQNRVGLNMHPM